MNKVTCVYDVCLCAREYSITFSINMLQDHGKVPQWPNILVIKVNISDSLMYALPVFASNSLLVAHLGKKKTVHQLIWYWRTGHKVHFHLCNSWQHDWCSWLAIFRVNKGLGLFAAWTERGLKCASSTRLFLVYLLVHLVPLKSSDNCHQGWSLG